MFARSLLVPRVSRTPIARITTPRLRLSSTQSSSPIRLPTVCPSCSAPLPTPLPACPKCSFIAPVPEDVPYHALFGLPDEPNPYQVDLDQLKKGFRAAQRICHPDNWVGRDQRKQDISSALSTLVNNAYNTLSSEFPRIEYLLRRAGYPMGETDKLDDPEFVMEIMEKREAIEGAQSDERERVLQIREENQNNMEQLCETIEQNVVKGNWESAKELAVQLKYMLGVERAARTWLD